MIYVPNREKVPELHQYEKYGLDYLTYPSLTATGVVEHLFTTRSGGVSTGYRSAMNLNVNNGDEPDAVMENYRRVGEVLGIQPEQMVLSHQTHTNNIRIVTAEDAGKGLSKERDYSDIDGLITKERGLALVTSYADCVPLYFVDPKKYVIGLAHSGWKGTVLQIGAKMVETMGSEFGCMPQDIITAIGPSICQDCYEVSEDVAQAFENMRASGGDGWSQAEYELYNIEEAGEGCGRYMGVLSGIEGKLPYTGGYEGRYTKMVAPGKAEGKYQLDLWAANAIILHLAGIPWENITIPTLCTCHNGESLFSHRASKGLRGNLSAFLMLR